PGWVRDDRVEAPVGAVIVLSSGLLSNGAIGSEGLDRLLTGLENVNRKLAPRLVTTRVSNAFHGQIITSDSGQHEILALGTPPPDWTVVDNVYSTRDEAL